MEQMPPWAWGLIAVVLTALLIEGFHVWRRKRAAVGPIPMTPAEARYERSKKVLDPTKRASLQPGHRTVPHGYREARPNEVISERTNPLTKPAEARAVEPRKVHISQPQERKAVGRESFEHKFFGSQLIVGTTVVARGLAKSMHKLEVTPQGNVFIDNLPYEINPGDLERLKVELAKL